jgi:HEPN domain-containing protein
MFELRFSVATKGPTFEEHDAGDLRAEEAAVLAQSGRQEGAYYLAGLAVECALKACIAKRTRLHQYPPKNTGQYYEHDLDVLLKLADLQDQLDNESKRSPARTKLAHRAQLDCGKALRHDRS